MTIHPTAVVSPAAVLGADVNIGPFCVVEPGAQIGDGCTLAARCSATHGQVATRIGSDCPLTAATHVAHDCVIGDRVIMTNNVMLGGHVEVGDRACLGGGAAVHQFCRVGRLSMVGGMARVVQDVPPFVTIDGQSGLVVGLNRVGLRRGGYDRHGVAAIKHAYQVIYRSGWSLERRLRALVEDLGTELACELAEFLSSGDRGFVRERRTPPGATIRVLADDGETPGAAAVRKAG